MSIVMKQLGQKCSRKIKRCREIVENKTPYKYLYHFYFFMGIGYITFHNNRIVKVAKIYKLYTFVLCVCLVLYQIGLVLKSTSGDKFADYILNAFIYLRSLSVSLSVFASWIVRIFTIRNISFDLIDNFYAIDTNLKFDKFKKYESKTKILILHIITVLIYMMHVTLDLMSFYRSTYLMMTFIICFMSDIIILRFFMKLNLIASRFMVLIIKLEDLFNRDSVERRDDLYKIKAIKTLIVVYIKLNENIDLVVSEFGFPVPNNFISNERLKHNWFTLS